MSRLVAIVAGPPRITQDLRPADSSNMCSKINHGNAKINQIIRLPKIAPNPARLNSRDLVKVDPSRDTVPYKGRRPLRNLAFGICFFRLSTDHGFISSTIQLQGTTLQNQV
jgi:hypothetical protein